MSVDGQNTDFNDNGRQEGRNLLSLVDMVGDNLRRIGEALVKGESLQTGQKTLSYFNKPVALTTEENKKTRRALRDFNGKADTGLLPSKATSPAMLEWGPPDSMRLMFAQLAHEGKTNYLHVKEITPQGGGREGGDKKRLFVTGSCLFGKYGVAGITDKGKTLNLCDPYQMRTATPAEYGQIREFDVMPGFHGYEVLSAISRHSVLGLTKADKVYFNVPFSPYILYAREAMRQGLMDEKILNDWVDTLAERVSDVIAYEQGTAGCEVIAVDPLYKYFDDLTNPDLSLEELTAKIAADDPWWEAYFRQNPPETFADIGNGSYTRVYYDLMNSGENIEVVAVEDQVEMRILLELQSNLKNQVLPPVPAGSGLVGLYPFTQVMLPNEEGHANAAFISDEYGRNDLSEEIFARAAASVPDNVLARARETFSAIQEKQLQRAANGNQESKPPVQSRLPLYAACNMP